MPRWIFSTREDELGSLAVKRDTIQKNCAFDYGQALDLSFPYTRVHDV